MTGEDPIDSAWLGSCHLRVYERLLESVDGHAPSAAPGTLGTVLRALDHFRACGDRKAVALLEAVSIALSRLQAALSDEPGSIETSRADLRRLTRAWLLAAPMHPAALPTDCRLAA